MLIRLLALTVPVTAVALVYARWEYRKRGRLTPWGFVLLCAMLFVPNLILEYATTYGMPSTLLDSGTLTTAGPYRWSRNPQYLGWFLFLLGFALNDWSLWCLAALLAAAISLHLLVLVEEEHLRRIFGEEYVEFCRTVPRYAGPRRAGA